MIRGYIVLCLLLCLKPALSRGGEVIPVDSTLRIWYDFAEISGGIVHDLSGHDNNGKVHNIIWHKTLKGRKGVVHFNSSSNINCGRGDDVRITGDMTLEMRIRLNNPPIDQKTANLFLGKNGFQLSMSYYGSTLAFYYTNINDRRGMMAVPLDKNILSGDWVHLALVVAYPEMYVYIDGELTQETLMLFPGIAGKHQNYKIIGGQGEGKSLCMDLDEFRLYERALSAEEISANYNGTEFKERSKSILNISADWYRDSLTLRYSTNNKSVSNKEIQFTIIHESESIEKREAKAVDVSMNNSGRYMATCTLPLSHFKNKSLLVKCKAEGNDKWDVQKRLKLSCPDWVMNQLGYSDKVLKPWTAVRLNSDAQKTSVKIWGREYDFSEKTLMDKISTDAKLLLMSPIRLTAHINNRPIDFQTDSTEILQSAPKIARFRRKGNARAVSYMIKTTVFPDGYIIFYINIFANENLMIDNLRLQIPLKKEFASLCYGNRVFPEDKTDPYNAWYSGKLKDYQSFRFSPSIWIGNEKVGLSWQAESNQYWHNSDLQKAIEFIRQPDVATLRFNFIDERTRLVKGDSLNYVFSLQATPIKPLTKDAWSLRIARLEPWGKGLNLPDRRINGVPALTYLKNIGVKRLFYNISDNWPWPTPSTKTFGDSLHRMIDAAHKSKIKVYPYLIHQRVPVNIPQFDPYGPDMTLRPVKQYVTATNPPNSARPGPIAVASGANSQVTFFFCPKSKALQDAAIFALNRRLQEYGDDGVYLDGTCHIVPCENLAHGCGYLDKKGKIHPTYPAFAVREFMKRIYAVVKSHNQENIVDLHCSWGYNPAGIAYADVIWNGEQFGPQYDNKGIKTGVIADALSLAQFRTEFTGLQIGVAAEMLCYRLGAPKNCAAISLLHDISPRLYTNSFSLQNWKNKTYYTLLPKIWKMRDEFKINQSQKLYYWENKDYVTVGGKRCFTTLFKNSETGVLAIVSNLSDFQQEVVLDLNLSKLGLAGKKLEVFNPISEKQLTIRANGSVHLLIESQGWRYVWIRPIKY